MSRNMFFVVILIIIFCFVSQAMGQSQPKSIPSVRTTTPPQIDGKLDDPCWQEAPKATDFVDQFFDKIVDDQTIAYILYDDENIYVAFHCYDSQPDKIVARETKRDSGMGDDDFVAFCIDPFHAHQFEYRSFFVVNAIGTQTSRIAGGRASKTEWKGDWKAAVSRTNDGWSAEMAIPFSIINYPSTGKPITVGANFDRMQNHTGIHSFWSNIGSPEQTEKDGHLAGIEFPKKKRSLSVMTYAFAGVESEESNTLRSGLDAKYAITPEMTAVASINPDFSNVEQDVESIDFSYRERYYSDRRPFFQEGSDIIGGGSWSFYSRRVPQFDLGMKVYGKTGRFSIGALDCVDFSNKSEIKDDPVNRNDVVISTKFDIGKSSSIPFKFVRMEDSESWNHAFILDPSFRRGNFSVGGAWEYSQTKGDKDGADYFAYCGWNSKHFYSSLFGSYVTPDFEIFDALIPYNDTKSGGFDMGYGTEWRTGKLKRIDVGINASRTDKLDGSIYESNIGGYGVVHFRSEYIVQLSLSKSRYEEYRDWTVKTGFMGNANNKYQNYGVNIFYGRREETDYRFLSPYVNFKFMSKLSLGLSSQFLWHKKDRIQHVLTINYDITPERGLGTRVVYRDGNYNAFVTYRQSLRKGIDAFIIIGDPNAEEMQRRALLKVIIPL